VVSLPRATAEIAEPGLGQDLRRRGADPGAAVVAKEVVQRRPPDGEAERQVVETVARVGPEVIVREQLQADLARAGRDVAGERPLTQVP
jgi:hypothetical protein